MVVSSSDDPHSQEETSAFNAYCNYCNNVYKFSTGGGYGTLRHHLTTKHPVECGVTATQTQLNFPPGGSASGSGPQSGNPLFKYDPKTVTEAFTRWAAMKHFPFGTFDDKKYEVTMQTSFNVAAKIIGRMSVQRSTI